MSKEPAVATASQPPDAPCTERTDLTEAIARLRRGIATLDHEVRQRLIAAFDRINGHFAELFIRLFGGGKAHLTLVEDEDPLAARS